MISVFSHLTPKCTPCELAAREALREQLGVGAIDTAGLVTSVNGVPTLNAQASQAIQLLLGGRYPEQTGSGRIINGVPQNEPALDPQADYQLLVAAQQGSGMTVLDQLKTVAPGAIALFDYQSVVNNINGQPEDLPYAIAKTAATAKVLAPSAQLVGLSSGPGAVSSAEASKSSTAPIVIGVAAGGVAFLATGNPLVGGAVGLAAGLIASKTS